MKKYALDTNLYMEAIRSVGAATELTSFYDTFAPGTWLSAIVLHEPLVGATSATRSRNTDFAAIRRTIKVQFVAPWPE